MTWKQLSGVRFAMHAASQLPSRGPTDVDLPLYLHFNKKSDENATFEKKENYHRFWLEKKKKTRSFTVLALNIQIS